MAVPGTSRNTKWENLETTGNRSSDNPYPEVWYFSHHSGQLNSPEAETNPQMVIGATEEIRHNHHMVTGATEEPRHNPHMVTRATEEFRQHPHMMTATQEEIPYCPPTTSSGKQKGALHKSTTILQ